MAMWTFEQIRARAAELPADDQPRMQIEIALIERLAYELERVREAVLVSIKANGIFHGGYDVEIKEQNDPEIELGGGHEG